MNVLVNGLVLNYQDSGKKDGEAILFLHGWASDISAFRALIDRLSSNYRCIALDLPGFGSSQTPKEPWDLSDFSQAVNVFLKKIDVNPYAVIGHSNGGAIAINTLATGGIKPKRLALLASSGIRSGGTAKKSLYKILSKPAKAGLAVLPKNRRESIKKRLYGRIGSDYMVSENMKETFKNIVSYDISSEAKKIKVPTLLIYGSDDDSTPPQMGRQIGTFIKGSELKVIDGGRHFIQVDKPEEVGRLIEDFLK